MLQDYKKFLKTDVFKTDEYLQFSLLLDAISQFDLGTHNHTAILERECEAAAGRSKGRQGYEENCENLVHGEEWS